MPAFTIDDSQWPRGEIRYEGLATPEEFDAYLEDVRRIRSRGPNVLILDGRKSGMLPARIRRRQAEWLDENRAMLERNSRGTVFVLESSVLRGALTAILWLAPIPGEWAVLRSLEEAERWADERLAKLRSG